MSELIFPFINLMILITVLVVYLREPIKGFVRTRHETIRDELQRVRDLLSQAKTRYEEFNGKLKAMDAEIAILRDQARVDAAGAKTRLIADAQKLNANIIVDARAAANGLVSELRHALMAEVGTKVVDRVERILLDNLTADDRSRLRRDFSTQVETAK